MGQSTNSGRVVVFGANGRLGGAVARQLNYLSPATPLRLVTSRPAGVETLRQIYPRHEIVLADFHDAASIRRCLVHAEAAFLVTPNFLDEATTMPFVVEAITGNPDFRRLIRIMGELPGVTLKRVPPNLAARNGPATQHLVARQVLEGSAVPVVYLNLTAALMDNLFANAPAIASHDLLAQPERMHGFIDPGDVGEIAARILLSRDERHVGHSFPLDNGQDLLPWSGVAELMSAVFLRPIRHDGSDAAFLEHLGPLYNRKMKREWAADYFLEYFKWEAGFDLAWRRTDFAETVLGRRPKSLRAWLEQHAAAFMPQAA